MRKFLVGHSEVRVRSGRKVPDARNNPYSAPGQNQWDLGKNVAFPMMHTNKWTIKNFKNTSSRWQHDDRDQEGVDYESYNARVAALDDAEDDGQGQATPEKKMVELLHYVLAENGPLSAVGIFEILQRGNWREGNFLFPSSHAVKDFMKDRPFLWDRKNRKFVNTSFGHRRCVVRICKFIKQQEGSCSFDMLFTFINNDTDNFFSYAGKDRMDQAWDDLWMMNEWITAKSVKWWLREQPKVFQINTDEDGKKRVSLVEGTVPSIASTAILPDHIHEHYYDRSREYFLEAKVVAVQKNYLKADIQHGTYKGRKIFVLADNVGVQHLDSNFQENDEVVVNAFISLGHKLHFTANMIALKRDMKRMKRALRHR